MRRPGGDGGINLRLMLQSMRIEALESELKTLRAQPSKADLRETAWEKLRRGALLRREEVAAVLDVSTKKIQRMENTGTLVRCPNLGTLVRYAARDVLRLAPAA